MSINTHALTCKLAGLSAIMSKPQSRLCDILLLCLSKTEFRKDGICPQGV